MSDVVAIIPARYASARFPGKALVEIRSKPLIRHTWERAARLLTVGRIIVATDDARIAAAVRGFGGEAVMTAADHPSGTDRVAEVARGLADPALVINLQGDEPVFDSEAVDALVRSMLDDPSVEMGTLAHPIRDDAEHRDMNVTKVVLDRSGCALYFSRAPIPFMRQRGFAGPLRHIGIYVFRAAFLQRFASLAPTPLEQSETLEQLRALEHGVRVRVAVTALASPGVDIPSDVARLEAYLEALAAGPAPGGTPA